MLNAFSYASIIGGSINYHDLKYNNYYKLIMSYLLVASYKLKFLRYFVSSYVNGTDQGNILYCYTKSLYRCHLTI